MRRGLPADGALDSAAPRANAVLLHDDGDAAIAEAVAACQHRPLEEQTDRSCFFASDFFLILLQYLSFVQLWGS